MVVTRSREGITTPARPQRNQEYWKAKKKLSPSVLRIKRESDSSSSSSSSDKCNSESKGTQNEPIPPKLEPRTTPEKNKVPSLRSNLSDVQQEVPYMSDSSSSSETRVLIQAGQCSTETDKVSLRHSKSNNVNSNNTSIRRELPFRKARHSLVSAIENCTVDNVLENESQWSFSDDSSSSFASSTPVPKVNQFKDLLRQKLSRKCQLNGLKKKSSIYPSESEIEKSYNNSKIESPSRRRTSSRVIRTPDRYQELALKRNLPSKATSKKKNLAENSISDNSIVVQKKTTTEDRNHSPIKASSTSDVRVKSFKIRLIPAQRVSPVRSTTEKQPKEVEVKNADASTSNTNETNAQKENRGNIAVCHQDIEDLLRQLEGSSDSEVEKNDEKSPEKRKLRTPVKNSQHRDKSINSEKEKNSKTIAVIRKLRISKNQILHNENSSDSVAEKSHKKLPLKRKLLTPMDKIRNNEKNTDTSTEFLIRRKKLHSDETKNRDKRKHSDEIFDKNDDDANHSGQRSTNSKSHIVDSLKCNICDERFTYPHVLRRHRQLMHEKRADFHCTKCDETFKRLDYLKNHERIVHLNVLFECKYCDKKYMYKHSKNNHEKKHKNGLLFKCPLSFCGKEFYLKSNFKKHKMTHRIKNLRTGGRSKYTCNECDKTFFDKPHLKIHVRKHLII